MLKRLFSIDAIITLFLALAAIKILQVIALQVDFLNPLARALNDFNLTDVVFSKLRTQKLTDTNIVLVNIGELDRNQIAKQIRRVTAESPKIICIDALFFKEKAAISDDSLAAAIAEAPKVVLSSKLLYNTESSCFDSVKTSLNKFSRNKLSGYANLINEDAAEYATIRNFSPFEIIQGKKVFSFATAIAWSVNADAVNRLLERGNRLEAINFRGDYGHFYNIDAQTALEDKSADISFIRNKIVIFGYLGRSLKQIDITDRFFTPFNERPVGRTLPDMYGVVIHANIVSMILNGDYINDMPKLNEVILNILISYCFVALLGWIYTELNIWYDTISTFVQLSFFLTLLFTQYLLFEIYRFRLDVSICAAIAALSGNVLEVYHDVIKNYAKKFRNTRSKNS